MSVDLTVLARERDRSRRVPRRRQPATLAPVRPRKTDALKYHRELRAIVKQIAEFTARVIFPLLDTYEHEYLKDSFVDPLSQGLNAIKLQLAEFDAIAAQMATRHISRVNQSNRKQFYRQLERVAELNLGSVVASEGLENVLKARTVENVSLIKTIPSQYFSQLETMVYESTITGQTTSRSLKRQIRDLWGVTDRRARVIARDQTAKLNADLNEQRNLDVGIEEYIWSTSKDERVRDSHHRKNKKKFRWDSPPKDTGHPGKDIQCRCVARSIVPT